MPLYLADGHEAATGVQLTTSWQHLTFPACPGAAVRLRSEANNSHVLSLENCGDEGGVLDGFASEAMP